MASLQNRKKKRKKEIRKRNRYHPKGYITVKELYTSGAIFWLSPISTKYYIKQYSNILKPVTFGKRVMGRKVYIPKKNLEKLIKMYKEGKIKKFAKHKKQIYDQAQIKRENYIDDYSSTNKYLNVLDVYKTGEIFWLKTYDAVRKYIRNPKYRSILKPFRFEKMGYPRNKIPKRGLCVSESNLRKFIKMFLNGEI